MKTIDGREYSQGRKYWYVSVSSKYGWLRDKPVFEPFREFWVPFGHKVKDIRIFYFITEAYKWIDENKQIISETPLTDFINKMKGGSIDLESFDHRAKLHDIVNTLSNDSCEDLIMVLEELHRAQNKHPEWPVDIIHRQSLVSEESGELTRACNNYVHENGTSKEVQEEAVQTAAVALRFLNNLIECKTV